MVDATDSKSVFCEGVRVRVPSPAVWESPGEISEWRFFRDFLYEKMLFLCMKVQKCFEMDKFSELLIYCHSFMLHGLWQNDIM